MFGVWWYLETAHGRVSSTVIKKRHGTKQMESSLMQYKIVELHFHETQLRGTEVMEPWNAPAIFVYQNKYGVSRVLRRMRFSE